MLNVIWGGLVLTAVCHAALTGRMADVSSALFESAKSAVSLVIGLTGAMMFLLGLMRIAFDGGLRDLIARALARPLRALFPEVPADHPAMSAMVMNLASNVLGLGNAATPFGLKSMVELDRLNPQPGAASDAMVLFLAINTSAVTLLPPFGTIGVRAAAGSTHPEAIWLSTLIATTCSTAAAVGAHLALRRLGRFAHRSPPGGRAEPLAAAADLPAAAPPPAAAASRPGRGGRIAVGASIAILALGLALELRRLAADPSATDAAGQVFQAWLFPLLVATLLLIGIRGRVPLYDSMVQGAREGLEVAIRIAPYLVAILVAVGMLRASGALDRAIAFVAPACRPLGVPPEVLPMALLRPLSGSGAFGVMSEILEAHGPDSFIGLVASTLQGSTETTFYVLALYLGAAGIRDGRHALAACLIGDLAGFVGAVAACHWLFG